MQCNKQLRDRCGLLCSSIEVHRCYCEERSPLRCSAQAGFTRSTGTVGKTTPPSGCPHPVTQSCECLGAAGMELRAKWDRVGPGPFGWAEAAGSPQQWKEEEKDSALQGRSRAYARNTGSSRSPQERAQTLSPRSLPQRPVPGSGLQKCEKTSFSFKPSG